MYQILLFYSFKWYDITISFSFSFFFSLAEKSCHGHEEGQCKGATYDDIVFGSFVHHLICSGLSDLIYGKTNQKMSVHKIQMSSMGASIRVTEEHIRRWGPEMLSETKNLRCWEFLTALDLLGFGFEQFWVINYIYHSFI